MKLLLIVIALIGCKGDERKSEAPPNQPVTAAPIAVVDARTVDAPPTATELESLRLLEQMKADDAGVVRPVNPTSNVTITLPAKGFDVKAILGRTRSQVAKVLGKEDKLVDITLYSAGGETVSIRAQFENGKAAVFFVEVSEYTNTVDNRNAVLAWAGATENDEWRVDLDKTVEIWDTAALARRDERKRVGGAIGDFMKRITDGAASAHAWGELETVMIVRGDGCTSSLLREFIPSAKAELGADLKKLGFVTMKCADGPSVNVR